MAKKSRSKTSKDEPLPLLPGLPAGVMPGDLQALMRSLQRFDERGSDEALDAAQEIAFEAMEQPTRAKRLALAKEAIARSPLCADGYLIIGDEQTRLDKAIDYYRQAVAAGTKALGERAFVEDVGDFWGLLETRPYMRAVASLASALWEADELDEATALFQELLRLNPNDNQGARYALLLLLLQQARDADASALWARYGDDVSAHWLWDKALIAFRQHGGDAQPALDARRAAHDHCPAVVDYLTGVRALPDHPPEMYRQGSEDEAIAYALEAKRIWEATIGAIDWLRGDAESTPLLLHTASDQGEPIELDRQRVEAATLALLLLGLHDRDRAWKGFDGDALDSLYRQGLISDPRGKAKSVQFSREGLDRARQLAVELFGTTKATG